MLPEDAAILDRIDGEALVARAVAWCAINSGSRNLAGVEAVGERIAAAMAGFDGEVERLPLPATSEAAADGRIRELANGAALRLRVRPDAPVQVALTGHHDTVYPADSAFQAVTRRADGTLNGPGIADMKGGLSVMLGALAAFEAHPLAANVGWTVLVSPDEETGSLASRGLLAELGARAHLHLTFEPAMDGEGTLAGARKGSGNFHLLVRGRAAHAGRDFASGRGAVAAAARIAAELDALNGRRDGVTLNVARIDGGAPLNMVPDAAVVRFNVRMPRAADARWLEGEIASIAAAHSGDGIATELHGGVTRPPKPFTGAQQAVFAAVREAGAALGQAISWKPSGGVCEGNNLFAAGCPGVDTLGVRGGAIHTPDEHAWPESFGERARLAALLLTRVARGEIDARAIRVQADAERAGVTAEAALG
ncbi:MAG: hydrolase [Caulobacteraceae bacterium]|nr:hydrolase [Caulobacter sp.]